MAGGLIQLVAHGIQDIYLTGDPQITFFKLLYRRHTNFSMESIVQNFTSAANFGETVSCTLTRSGDLVGKIFLHVEIPAIPKFIDSSTGEEDEIKKIAWVQNLGYALIQEISIEIGGKLIDRQYGEWMYIWSELTNKQNRALDKMIGNIPSVYQFTNGKPGYKLYIPLEFWFCRNTGLSLPLTALSSSDVKIIVTFRKLEECYRIGPTHSIEIVEDIVPFKPGDYIEQTVKNQTIYGYVIGYNYLAKKLYYIKIVPPTATKKTFESIQDIAISNGILNSNSNSNNTSNMTYRIYNVITRFHATPMPKCKETMEQLNISFRPKFVNACLYVNFIYLDNDERSKFVKTNHEYLIEQIQFNQQVGVNSPNVKQKLALNHPCKSHYWILQMDSLVGVGTINDLYNYTTSPVHYPKDDVYKNNLPMDVLRNHSDCLADPNSHLDNQHRFYGLNILESAKLMINGQARFKTRNSEYFNWIEPYEHHYRGPSAGIYTYSFAIYPEEIQPSSAINMSKIDDINMMMRLNNTITPQNMVKIRSYTVNYNILRIVFGLGGLAFV